MEIPLIGKGRRSLPWALGLVICTLLGIGAAAIVINRNRNPAYNLETLTLPVEATALTVRITTSGTVEPIQTVNLSPKTSGILEQLYVEQGDQVQRGDVIARMENRDVAAQFQQREAAVAEAAAQLQDVEQGADPEAIAQAEAAMKATEAQVRDAEARLDLAQTQQIRNQQLQIEGAISDNDMDSFDQSLRSAQATLESARFQAQEARQRLEDLLDDPDPEDLAQAQARLAQAEAQLQATQVQLEDTELRAPFAGTITQKFATEGAFVTPTTSASTASSATSTAIVALASELEVMAEVPEADIAQIFQGQGVEIVADAYPEEVFQGEVRLIAPEAIERQDVTLFQVRIDLVSGQDRLRSNMNVTVAFIGDQLTDALVVPAIAVITQGGQAGVLIPGDRNQIRFKPVTLGSQVGEQIQVLEGLQEGERVFIDLPPGKTLENLTFGRDAEAPAPN